MNGVDTYIISVCCALILSGVVYVMRPSGNLQTTIKIVTVIFILCVCISPLIEFDNLSNVGEFNISKEYKINTDLQDYINNESAKESKEQLAVKLGEILSARGINDYSVKFEVNDNYKISSVNIYTRQKSIGLKEYLESKLDISVNILEE